MKNLYVEKLIFWENGNWDLGIMGFWESGIKEKLYSRKVKFWESKILGK